MIALRFHLLFLFAPPPKQWFKKDFLTDTVAAVLAKAISPGTASVKDASRLDHLPLTTSGKSADLRMKNLQLLRYIEQLFEDKRSILNTICKIYFIIFIIINFIMVLAIHVSIITVCVCIHAYLQTISLMHIILKYLLHFAFVHVDVTARCPSFTIIRCNTRKCR